MKFVLIPLLLSCLLPGILSAQQETPNVHKDIQFAKVDGHSLKLDLYLPENKKSENVGDIWSYGFTAEGGELEVRRSAT